MKNFFQIIIFVIPAALSVSCNSVTDGYESQAASTFVSDPVIATVYTCADVSGEDSDTACSTVAYPGANCDGRWTTFNDGALGYCYFPRDGWESCSISPGKWVLNANASAFYSGDGVCKVHASVFGCDSTVCKCDDNELVDISESAAISGDIGDEITVDYTANTTIPASITAVCEFGGDESSSLYGGGHTIAACNAISRIVSPADVTVDVYESGHASYASMPGGVSGVCVVPVPYTDWQLDIADIDGDGDLVPDLGCPSGWTFGGYAILRTHTDNFTAHLVAPDDEHQCTDRVYARTQTGSDETLTALFSIANRTDESISTVASATCTSTAWASVDSGTYVMSDLTHVVCY